MEERRDPRGEEADWPVAMFESKEPSNSLTLLGPGVPGMSRSFKKCYQAR